MSLLTPAPATMDGLQHFPLGFQMWSPAAQAGVLFLSTFVLEDVAAVGAGLLVASGALAWPLAFSACFMGIWIGDAGLYGLARVVGRSWFEKTSLKRYSSRVEQSERWFAKRGDWILVFSRLLPGARLPTYLAAGFLRLPLNRFLLITGTASLFWTVLLLFCVQALGSRVLLWMGGFRHTGWVLWLSVPALFLVLQLIKCYGPEVIVRVKKWTMRLSSMVFRLLTSAATLRLRTRFARWLHWEFWPAWLFYPPVTLYCLWLAVKYRGLTLPTASNPGIFSGGLIGESKMAILQPLMDTSPQFTAEAELLKGSTPDERLASVREICGRRNIDYPFILKPDVGQRGVGVKLIRSEAQAIACLNQTQAPLLLQRYAPGPDEAGIFYYRFPHETRGHIFAITEKVFPVITGDGVSTIPELVWADPRARFMAAKYLQRLSGREDEILPAGEKLRLVHAGDHAQGCVFQDGTRFWTQQLEDRIDAISRSLPGFYIGRYDIRYPSEESLRAGRDLQIVELNGAASEATSIYDARNSLFAAYHTLFRQWELVFAIGAANRRDGAQPTPILALYQKWREFTRHAVSYPAAD